MEAQAIILKKSRHGRLDFLSVKIFVQKILERFASGDVPHKPREELCPRKKGLRILV